MPFILDISIIFLFLILWIRPSYCPIIKFASHRKLGFTEGNDGDGLSVSYFLLIKNPG